MQTTHPTTSGPETEAREQWRSNTRREWSDEQKVAAWRRWGRVNIVAQRDATAALLHAAQLEPGMRVIDIGGGGGDPSLEAAASVGPRGHVTVTDISEGMLETARQFALEDGLTNLDYRLADAEHLPFADHSFDRALCRCAVMFLADQLAALREIRRVLKPIGCAAFLAWGPLEANPFFSGVFMAIGKVLPLPQPPPGAPHPFKFAVPGSLSAALEEAGYRDVTEQTIQAASRWEVTPEQLTELMVAMGGLDWLLSQMSPGQRTAVLGDMTAHFQGYWTAGAVELPLSCVIATGTPLSE
jgi:SAM-dependent methyltransferase